MDIGTKDPAISEMQNSTASTGLQPLAGISQKLSSGRGAGKKRTHSRVLSYMRCPGSVSRDFYDDKLESRFCQDPLLAEIYRMSPGAAERTSQFLNSMEHSQIPEVVLSFPVPDYIQRNAGILYLLLHDLYQALHP